MYLCRGSQSQAKNQLLVLRSLANIFAKETGIQLMDYERKWVRFCSHFSDQCYSFLWQLLNILCWYALHLCLPHIGSVSSWLHVLHQQQRQPDCSGHPTVEVSKKKMCSYKPTHGYSSINLSAYSYCHHYSKSKVLEGFPDCIQYAVKVCLVCECIWKCLTKIRIYYWNPGVCYLIVSGSRVFFWQWSQVQSIDRHWQSGECVYVLLLSSSILSTS